MKPSLVFVGFMGAGKSTALRAARDAGLPTVEIDELMEAAFGCTIPQAFERHGEEGFREREAEVVGSLLENADDGGAIALGGGSVLSPRIRAAMARHIVVWLQVDAAEAWRRIAHSDRPLAKSQEGIAALFATREPLYEELADAVVPMGDRQIVRRALPAIRELAKLPAGTKLLWASAPGGEYPVLVGRGLIGCGWWPLESRRFVVTDRSVGPLYADRLEPVAGTAEIEAGETAKTLVNTEKVLRAMAREGMTRGTTWSRSAAASSATSAGWSPTSTSAASRWSRCRPRWSPRSTPPTAARPASTCRRARTTRAPSTSRPR